jgi:hypothetical protein
MSRDRLQARRDKFQNIKDCESDGVVADNMDVRTKLMEQVRSGEKTLDEVQKELRKIQRDAKKNGKITRNQAFIRG